ncbi:MAG: hypothetical protein MUD12_12925 [Spirochaetes bacterium]|nr:hypothetical protein [Spirochaetota bacterium]
MKTLMKFSPVFCLLFLISCFGTSTQVTKFSSLNKSTIDTWYLDFTYNYGKLTETVNESGKKSESVTKVIPEKYMQFLDHLYYSLSGDYKINVKKGRPSGKNYGLILINPLDSQHILMSQLDSVDVTIYDNNEKLTKRLYIKNDYTSYVFFGTPKKDLEPLAKYTAGEIKKALGD